MEQKINGDYLAIVILATNEHELSRIFTENHYRLSWKHIESICGIP
ncbi:MAG: hypothetical protein ABIF11_11720 [Nitrospirota bacterium]